MHSLSNTLFTAFYLVWKRIELNVAKRQLYLHSKKKLRLNNLSAYYF